MGFVGAGSAQTGSVSFIQRFTQDLRLFPHVHVLVPDGLFLLPDDGAADCQFHVLPPPTDDDVSMLTVRLAERLQGVAQRHLEQSGEHTDG
ncbi:MAG: hypothetical protein AMXMBFR64_23740 [Myxococcales bacterium]